jgi:hypothetical protein
MGPKLPGATCATKLLERRHFRLSAAEKATLGLGSPGALVLAATFSSEGNRRTATMVYVYRVGKRED